MNNNSIYFCHNYKDAGFYESDIGEFQNSLLIAEDLTELWPINN